LRELYRFYLWRTHLKLYFAVGAAERELVHFAALFRNASSECQPLQLALYPMPSKITRTLSQKLIARLALASLSMLAGCQSIPLPNVWPFPERERTTYLTPAMRVEAVQQYAMRSTGTDTPEQREITDQLARQIQVEPDPLVRQAVVKAIAEFRTPMAQQVLEAGLQDADKSVRVACCQALGRRGETASVDSLATALRSDEDIDVRLAATEALGQIKSPESIQAITVALDDRDPAMQYVGVESMKSITGQDYGPDVQTWRQVAAGQSPAPVAPPTVAERLRRMSPF
jgi:hypothetical protein